MRDHAQQFLALFGQRLQFGRLALGARDTRFTPDEQRTLMTLWSIARSPLIMGGDLRHLDEATLALLTLLLAVVAHAGVNVFNDYYDHLNGTDAANVDRLLGLTVAWSAVNGAISAAGGTISPSGVSTATPI